LSCGRRRSCRARAHMQYSAINSSAYNAIQCC
jgi:hypothetical protein